MQSRSSVKVVSRDHDVMDPRDKRLGLDCGYLYWLSVDRASSLPPGAVPGSFEIRNKERSYIARAKIHGNVVPGKVNASEDRFHSTWNGQLATSREYDVLVNRWNVQGLQWIRCSCGQMSSRAVQGGHTRNGEPLYIARALTPDMVLCIGTYRPTTGRCYIPWRDKEISTDQYELLCHRSKLQNKSYIYAPSKPLMDSLKIQSIRSPFKIPNRHTVFPQRSATPAEGAEINRMT